MTHGTVQHAAHEGGLRIAVYRITQTGERTMLRPERQVQPAAAAVSGPGFPACECPRCRAEQ